MPDQENKNQMLYWAARMGIPVSAFGEGLQSLRLHEVRIIDLLPEMLIMVRSVVADKTLSYRRKSIDIIDRGLLISFQNIISRASDQPMAGNRHPQEQPHVQITPLHLESEVLFPAGITIRQISILIGLDYLKNFLGKDHRTFEYLFHQEKTLLIEEFMSPQMATVVNEVVHGSSAITLPEAYYKLKSLELLYLLFTNLAHRQAVPHQHLRHEEIEAVYRVRDRIASSLDKPWAQDDLVKLSGMNTIRLRKLFTQVFGKGLYEYHQFLRMQEAARLLQQEHLSVSETGYRLGFTNLSHFGRLFERHFGTTPKKWSAGSFS
ncbi:HTH-type transcriptional activator RhaR [Dyadobacter sp. CECT 9275]|uniref:HTH-type transcriptional activator RhaR n=1 Tax=Dyadobacter helix TaxID=2822344 RepID=A0A916JAT5_9BACT|nr:AraC family transcriptional regulator [Dyadobacter sp. CECT 9275]CAG4997268.1 HTH-type transcriptional activator RhaR [Dyadobacter sp. CECT 9275]